MSLIKSYQGESATDLTVRGLRNAEGLVDFCLRNGIAVDSDETASLDRIVDDALKAELAKIKPVFQPKPIAVEPAVIVDSDQNIIDLALQETGSVEGLVDLLVLNGLSPDDNATAGSELKIKGLPIISDDVRRSFKASNYKVNTGTVDVVEPPIETFTIAAMLSDRSGAGEAMHWTVSLEGDEGTDTFDLSEDGDTNITEEISFDRDVLRITKTSQGGAIYGRVLIKLKVNGSIANLYFFFLSGEVIGPIVNNFNGLGLGDIPVIPGDTVEVEIYENINEFGYEYTSNVVADYQVNYVELGPDGQFNFSGNGMITQRNLVYVNQGTNVTSRVQRTGVAVGTVVVSWRRNGSEVGTVVVNPGNPVDVSFIYNGIIPEDGLNVQIFETA